MVMMCFYFNDTATSEIYTLSLHDALPISCRGRVPGGGAVRILIAEDDPVIALALAARVRALGHEPRSEEHTSELQSRRDLVCRLLLEKKKQHQKHDVGTTFNTMTTSLLNS